ncbi:gustatory receptor 8a-like [Rhagoletis pomonella]|uniref:gustatory receptor 8a-like n=1 Tax=Rhagoletis pomonella TaxID=28610 RepID=UPI0017849D26|nr:gustatory receptor 8a-like [Rhagoletis pomonella]
MTIQVPGVVHFHIRFFQIIGCFDASLQTQPRLQKIAEQRLVTWTNLLLLIFSLTTVNTFFRPDAFLFTTNRFGYFNDVLKVCMAQVTILIIYTETVWRRRALRHFWQRYALLTQVKSEQFLSNESNWRVQLSTHRHFLYILYGITVLDLLIEVIFFSLQPLTDQAQQFWFMFTPFVYLVHLRNMQIVFHIEIIRHELEKLRNDVGLLAEYTNFARRVVPFAGFEDFVRRKLAEKQLVFQRIHEMLDYFRNAFGMSIIAVLLMIYVRVVVDAYFMFYNKSDGWYFAGIYSYINK